MKTKLKAKKILFVFAFLLLIVLVAGCNMIDGKIPAIEGDISENPVLIEEIEYDKDKILKIYEDHFEADDRNVLYNDIEIVRYVQNMSTWAQDGWLKSYFYEARYIFVLSNGDKITLKCGLGVRWWPFSKIDDETKLSVNTFIREVYINVVTSVAERAYEQIINGATLNIAGLNINSSDAMGKNDTRINADNYGKYEYSGEYIRVIAKTGEELFRTKITADNADLLPYILNSLFITNVSEHKDVEIIEIPKSIFQRYGFWIIFGSILFLIFILGLFFHIRESEGDGFFIDGLFSILGAFGWVIKGMIPVLLITQLVWWIIVEMNGWNISFWFFIF